MKAVYLTELRFKTGDATMPIFIISVDNVTQYLDTDTLTLKNTTIQQSAQQMLDALSSIEIYYKLIRQNDIKIAGNEGLKTEYLIGNFYGYDVYTIINGKLYTFTYKDEPGNVPETVQLANKVVESFKVVA